MSCYTSLSTGLLLLFLVQLSSIGCLTTSCQKNRFIDYNQMVETQCLIETCILSSNCTATRPCECKRDFVVRYNVTVEHDDDDEHDHDDEDDDRSTVHFGVIWQGPPDDTHPIILIGELYTCYYDERDISTVFWSRPNRQTYYILLTLSLVIVFAIIIVPIIYLVLTIKSTNFETKKSRK